MAWLSAIIIALVPFHAFLTVWVSSLAGHYTLIRLWKEFLLLPIIIGSLVLLFRDKKLLKAFASSWLIRLILIYFLLLLVCGLGALTGHDVTAKAMLYGLLVDSRFLIFFLAVLVIASRDDLLEREWQKLLFGPAVLVAAVAVLQYWVLPYDFMRHFGYSQSTIFPYETINHNLNRIRVMSTLRGANPLGAYLLVPISALGVWLIKDKRQRRDKLVFGAGLLLALVFSFSRSAWIGALISLAIIAWSLVTSPRLRRGLLKAVVPLAIVLLALSFLLRNNTAFQDAVLHTDRNSTIAVSSNQGHSSAFKSAAKDIGHHPLGGGVGTAGPQSFYNHQREKLAENYFLQIGQETGVFGLVLFAAISAALAACLYKRRAEPLALALFASFIGLCAVNLFSHAWADDTLAYVFWGLAGLALAPIITDKHKQKNAKKIKRPA